MQSYLKIQMDRMPHKQHRLNNGAFLKSPAMYPTRQSSISARSSLQLLQTSDAMKQLSGKLPILCTSAQARRIS